MICEGSRNVDTHVKTPKNNKHAEDDAQAIGVLIKK